jgi:hypothetical protein
LEQRHITGLLRFPRRRFFRNLAAQVRWHEILRLNASTTLQRNRTKR